MPFFLVTHASLIDARDEEDAARKAIAAMRNGRQVIVTVKSDEVTVKQVVVEAMTTEVDVFAPDGGELEPVLPTAAQNSETAPQFDVLDEPGEPIRTPRKLVAFLLPFITGSLLIGVIDRFLL